MPGSAKLASHLGTPEKPDFGHLIEKNSKINPPSLFSKHLLDENLCCSFSLSAIDEYSVGKWCHHLHDIWTRVPTICLHLASDFWH